MVACASEKGICLLEFGNRKNFERQIAAVTETPGIDQIIDETNDQLNLLKEELAAYFSGDLQKFSVNLDITGTEFQVNVWNQLLKIPYGKTISYIQLAKETGKPKSVRAVANANAMNKIAILVPCHRVIGANGSLTGYAGGLHRKKWLLDLENPDKGLFD